MLKSAEKGAIGRIYPQRLQHDKVGTSDSAPNEEWWHFNYIITMSNALKFGIANNNS